MALLLDRADMSIDTVKLWFRKYAKLIAVLLLVILTVIFYYLSPSRNEKRITELEACQKQCFPLARALEGQSRLPNVSPTERRNYATHAKCVCR